MPESPETPTPTQVLLALAFQALESGLKETALGLIDDARDELNREIAQARKPRRITWPSVEDLMEAPINSVLQHHPVHGRLIKESSHLWRAESPVSYTSLTHHCYYYYAEEISELQSMTLFYPESEEA